jgi:hypothetical protein
MTGLNAPARRVGLFYDSDFAAHMDGSGGAFVSPYWRLFDAAVEWASGERPRQFAEVFRAEWSEIRARRYGGASAEGSDAASPPSAPPENLAGLALSGGGIRAATYSLGLLQGLRRSRLLGLFDYLSTVSGGGYIGGWWSAWLSRPVQEQRGGQDIFPPRELLKSEEEGSGPEPEEVNSEVADEILSAGRDPVHHLRLFSNYLTPRKGVLSPDTWRAVTVVSRNIFLTWVVLLPILIAALLLGKLYFVLQSYSYDATNANAFFIYDAHSPNALALFGKFAGWEVLRSRLLLTAWPLLLILILLAVTVSCWIVWGDKAESRREWWAGMFGGAVVLIMIALDLYLYFSRPGVGPLGAPYWFWVLLPAATLGILAYIFYPTVRRLLFTQRERETDAERQWRVEVLRYRITRMQARLVVLFVLAAFVLLLGGFGHELINYVLQPDAGPVAKAGGWLAALSAVAGSIFTALKNSPSGGSDERLLDENQSALNRLIFRTTPPLVLLVFAVAISWAASALLNYMHLSYLDGLDKFAKAEFSSIQHLVMAKFAYVNWKEDRTNLIPLLTIAMCLGALLSLYFVLVETRWRNSAPRNWLVVFWGALALYLMLTVTGKFIVLPRLTRCLAQSNVSSIFGDNSTKSNDPSEAKKLRERRDAVKELVALRLFPEDVGNELLAEREEALKQAGKQAEREEALRRAEREGTVEEEAPRESLDWTCFSELYLSIDRRLLGIIFFITYFGGWEFIFRLHAGERRPPRRLVPSVLIVLILIVLSIFSTAVVNMLYENEEMFVELWLVIMFGGVLLYCLLFVTLESAFGSSDNKRALWLLTSVYLVLTTLLIISGWVDFSDARIHHDFTEATLDSYIKVMLGEGVFAMFGASLTWVVAMGWMADPNRLSLHEFYRSRLVRAYLGASNNYRSQQLKTIREVVEGDDVRLQDLRNCRRGAPYHLINTTLNLVGGRDLTTAQRSADAFILSKLYCGSSRTGYRDTREYMDGQLSLGTAVAVSGAAASPNMGSKTLTSSLAMLMTFLNVRLGYWAPTPNKKEWRENKARLWPFYMLREFTSQTNDLSTYCYLTDGGHFDNTGLYSLVERACRFIIVADCGADPKPCFQDIGDALRRCRIDFGAEIDLDLTPLMRTKDADCTPAHFAVGSIVYSKEHVESLGWEQQTGVAPVTPEAKSRERLSRTGVIVLFKPSITNNDEPADVRQYNLENSVFPQQTTVDQWFDEAQFESYRRLGHLCAHSFCKELEALQLLARHLEEVLRIQLNEDYTEMLIREASEKFDLRSPFKGGSSR